MLTYIWRHEGGAGFAIGHCVSRDDAIEHLRYLADRQLGDHHFTAERLKIVVDDHRPYVAERMWNAVDQPRSTQKC